MLVVDPAAWIDVFNAADEPAAQRLAHLLDEARSPLDVLVATFCIERDYALLHRDRDFDAFDDLRGLRTWRH